MKGKFYRIIPSFFFAVLFILNSSPAMCEMGLGLPVIKKGESLMAADKKVNGAMPVLTSTGTISEMGFRLPVINEGQGLLATEKAAARSFDTAASVGDMGEMGVRLPVLKEGEGFLTSGKKKAIAKNNMEEKKMRASTKGNISSAASAKKKTMELSAETFIKPVQ